MKKSDPEIEILPREKKKGDKGMGPLAFLLAICAVWAVAFVMGLRLRHPLPRVILGVLALGLTFAIYRSNKEG